MLCTLKVLHQKGALSYERSFGSSLDPLSFVILPVKCPENSNKLLNIKDLDLKSINTTTAEEFIFFDSDSSHLCQDSCITSGLKGFKSDFIEGSYAEVTERSSDTNAGKSVMIG